MALSFDDVLNSPDENAVISNDVHFMRDADDFATNRVQGTKRPEALG